MHLRFKGFTEESRAWRDNIEQRFLAEEKEIEEKALELFEYDPTGAQKYITEYTAARMEEIVERYHRFFWHVVERRCSP